MKTTNDETEDLRRERIAVVNGAVESQDRLSERTRLEALNGQVWDAAQLAHEFEVLDFLAPYVVVRHKSDGRKGSLEFQHSPRFYFNFVPD